MRDFDYIVVGAGSAGAVLASRLSEDARNQVLLVEAGGETHFLSRFPLSFGLFIEKRGVNWLYQSTPEPTTGNREIPVPRGKMLGGSSAINGLVWVRGQPLDYNTWAQMGARGWSWADIAPLFTRIEGYEKGGRDGRGKDGPLKITEVPDESALYDALFKAAEAAGYKINADYNSEDQEGVVKTQASIWRGQRMSVARCYLEPARTRPNLTIVTNAPTRKIVLEGKRCTGIVYEHHGELIEARAGRDVVLCAGAVATPQLLELNGIGNPEILGRHGIPVAHALTAVGENFRDHLNARLIWKIKNKSVSYNHRAQGLAAIGEGLRYITSRGGFISLPSAPMLAFLRTRPDMETPDVQMHIVPYSIKDPKTRKLQDFPSMSMSCYQLRPESLGTIHIRSSDPNDHPAIKFNFLSDPIDQRAMTDGVRIVRKIVESAPMDGLRGDEFSPGKGITSDDEILDWVRQTAQTAYHPIGTCRMGPAGQRTVVDERLRVHGLQGLRIADASIFPTMPSGNTNAPAIMVGEKAADLLKADAR